MTSPNGDERWVAGTTHDITWDYISGGCSSDLSISLYKNGVYQYTIAQNVYSSSGSYSWTIPSLQESSYSYRIQISCNADSEVYDTSDNYFNINRPIGVTSPNGGQTWQAGTTHDITWSFNSGGYSSILNIALYKGGVFQYYIATNVVPGNTTYSWTIPVSQISGSDYKIRIACNDNPNIYDESDNNFTISSCINVTGPNGGETWQGGSSHFISWSILSGGCSSTRTVSLYKGGVFQYNIATNVAAGVNSYSWTIPAGQATGSDYKIRVICNENSDIFDESDASFSITSPMIITSPNGGESWTAGTMHSISWTIPYGVCSSNASISLYRDGVFQYVITNNVPASNCIYSWTIPADQAVGSGYRIRISCNANPDIYDESNANFSITSPITVTSPNGGESWTAGTNSVITWNSTYGGCSSYGSISLYKGGELQYVMASNVNVYAGNGSYIWNIPAAQETGSDYKIRISCNANPNIFDESNANFTIHH